MPIGPYSPCPGGTGKKIKFCCPDLLGELQKIERMLDGKQFQACLTYLERLEQAHPGKACLLATKVLLLRALEKIDEAETSAAAFLEKYPDNPLALAETAMLTAVTRSGSEAMPAMSRAIEASGTEMHSRVYEAMGLVSRVLVAEGQSLAAAALASLQLNIQENDRRPLDVLLPLNTMPTIPLVVKEGGHLRSCPPDAPWKADFDEAVRMANRARWVQAAERLADLSRRVDGAPAVWWNLATVLGWLADTPGCIEALRKFASLDVPLEDAVEAEALACFLSGDPLGDQFEMLRLRYPVQDAERLQAALTAAPQAEQMQIDPAALAEDEGPPPRAVFVVFDRQRPEPAADITLEALPKVICEAMLYGKETDREARLELLDVSSRSFEQTKALVADLAGDALASEAEQEVIGQMSASQELLSRNWRLPPDISQEDFRRLVDQYLEAALLETWPQVGLGLLDGKSPQEAADQQAYRVRLLAAIMVLEHWLQVTGARFDCNRLRSRLGLPTLEPIDPGETSIEELPLVRLGRVMVEKLSDEALLDGYRRVAAYRVDGALPTFARAVTERPSLSGREEQLRAYQMLARMTDDSEEALRHVDEGRKAAEAAGQSSAPWDLMELRLRFERREGSEASRLLSHLDSQHSREPGVAQAVTNLLIQVGLLRPDGTPAVPVGQPEPEPPSLVVPGVAGAKPGELWTPDSERASGEKPKLWTPGMD